MSAWMISSMAVRGKLLKSISRCSSQHHAQRGIASWQLAAPIAGDLLDGQCMFPLTLDLAAAVAGGRVARVRQCRESTHTASGSAAKDRTLYSLCMFIGQAMQHRAGFELRAGGRR